MTKYRLIERGHRMITDGMGKGVFIPCGSIVEKLMLVDNSWTWVYVDTMHPTDAANFIKKHNREYTDKEIIDWLQYSPNPNISTFLKNWLACEGGYSIRSTFQHIIEKSK